MQRVPSFRSVARGVGWLPPRTEAHAKARQHLPPGLPTTLTINSKPQALKPRNTDRADVLEDSQAQLYLAHKKTPPPRTLRGNPTPSALKSPRLETHAQARQHQSPGSGSRVQGRGFRVQGAGCRVQGSGFRVQGSGFRVQSSGFGVQGAGCRVQGSGSRVQGAGFRVQGAG